MYAVKRMIYENFISNILSALYENHPLFRIMRLVPCAEVHSHSNDTRTAYIRTHCNMYMLSIGFTICPFVVIGSGPSADALTPSDELALSLLLS